VVSWRALSAVAGLVLVTGCAKIFGVDDSGIAADGGAGQPCDMNGNSQTECGQGLVCLGSNSYGTGNVCARTCTADQECAPGQGCLAVNQPNGGGSGAFVYACQPNTSCNNGACGTNGTTCSNGMCRDTCTIGNGGGPSMGTCPTDETCVPSCPSCFSGVCAPNGSSGDGGDGNAGLAPMPLPRGQVACAVASDNKVYVFGGMDQTGLATDDVQIYDPASNSWSTGPKMITARFAAGVGFGQQPGIFFVAGGFETGGPASNTMAQFDAFANDGGSWSLQATMPMPLGGSAVAGIGRILVAGGATTATGAPVGTVLDWQLPGQWSTGTSPSLQTPRKYMAAASPQGGLLAIGGYDASGAASNVVERTGGTSWSYAASMPTSRGKLAAATGPNGIVYVVGGANGGAVGDLASYDPNTNAWTTLPSMPTPRAGLCAAFVSGGTDPQRLCAIGGEEEVMPVKIHANVEAFDPSTMKWSQ
jgi:hypothetical protein